MASVGIDIDIDSVPDTLMLETAAPVRSTAPGAPRRPTPAQLGPGALLGRYIVLRPLGAGGLGEVFAAFDPQLDRKVAVKVLKAAALRSDSADQLQERLVREAQAMAKLAHPNVVAVHDVGTDGEAVFIAMELVDGVTLRAWAHDEPRTWQEIRHVLVQVGNGLLAAHRAGILHRDLKPTNVMLGKDGRVRVLDFGLARQLSVSDSGVGSQTPLPDEASTCFPQTNPMTDSKLLMGTPGYMAPEQYTHGILDARTDQFAFCVTMYETIYGTRPFRGKTVAQIQAATLAGQLPPPPEGKPVPKWLRNVIARGLKPDPAERYPSLEELLADLVKDRRSRRRMSLVAMTGLLVAVLAVAGAFVMRPDPPPDDRVEQLANQARAAAAKIHFVYPPPEDPEAPTAYHIVQLLEQLDGAIEAPAQTQALALREEFSSTLTRLGDRYWDEDGGRPFAIDYYVSALVFDPDNQRARERAAVTQGELIALRTKADAADFTEAELAAAQTLVALADEDDVRRRENVGRIARDHRNRAASTSANLERLLGADSQPPAATPAPEKPGKVAIADAPSGLPTSAPTTAPPAAPVAASAAPQAKPTATTKTAADRESAKAYVEKARAALRSGNLKDAEAWFHRALDVDRSHADALAGLAELYFEQGAYQRALEFARRGVKAAPKSGRHQIILGDTCFKVLRYSEARSAYDAAHKLGHASAKARLARLDETLGTK